MLGAQFLASFHGTEQSFLDDAIVAPLVAASFVDRVEDHDA